MVVPDAKESVLKAIFSKYDFEKNWMKDFLRESTGKSY